MGLLALVVKIEAGDDNDEEIEVVVNGELLARPSPSQGSLRIRRARPGRNTKRAKKARKKEKKKSKKEKKKKKSRK